MNTTHADRLDRPHGDTPPLLRLGPGGEYQRAWSEAEIHTIWTLLSPELLVYLAIIFFAGCAVGSSCTDSPVKRPPAANTGNPTDGVSSAAATF